MYRILDRITRVLFHASRRLRITFGSTHLSVLDGFLKYAVLGTRRRDAVDLQSHTGSSGAQASSGNGAAGYK